MDVTTTALAGVLLVQPKVVGSIREIRDSLNAHLLRVLDLSLVDPEHEFAVLVLVEICGALLEFGIVFVPRHLDLLLIDAINLLAGYDDPDTGLSNFFMEPGEEYRVQALVFLRPGLYLLKATFVGTGSEEYWAQMETVLVP